MKAININGNIKVYNKIPKFWGNTYNYDKLGNNKHIEDGFRDVIIPNLTNSQVLGNIILDQENDVFTYEIIDKTSETLKNEYTEKVENVYSHLYIRALASSMNKNKLDINFLTAQREEYQDKYDVAKGKINSGSRFQKTLDLINEEMSDEFDEPKLDAILTSFGVTGFQGTQLEKMFKLIEFKFEYGRVAFDSFNKFIRHFRTKCFYWIDNNDFTRLDQAISLASNLPESMSIQDAETIYNQFKAI